MPLTVCFVAASISVTFDARAESCALMAFISVTFDARAESCALMAFISVSVDPELLLSLPVRDRISFSSLPIGLVLGPGTFTMFSPSTS